MNFLGIDPGITGGVAIIDSNGAVLLAESMPTQPAPQAGKRWVDGAALGRLIRPHNVDMAAIEHVGAMPGQGVTSMFTFGMTFGIPLGVLGALLIGVQLVRPQAWKKHHSLSADKNAALGVALRRWPDLGIKKSEDGIAEALLIADWLRHSYHLERTSHV